MDIINQIVIHKTFGGGKIISLDNRDHLTIQFQEGEKIFQSPTAFQGYLMAKDAKFGAIIQNELDLLKEKNKAEEEKIQKIAENKSLRVIEGSQNTHTQKPKKAKVYPRSNIAFKCNYCDGGQSDTNVGFNGVCSDETIHYNIKIAKRIWCSSEECACGQYLNGEITRKELDELCSADRYVCYESQMLRDWKALAGGVQTGENKGRPMKLKKVQSNSLCVLTTRDPNSDEKDRYVFAVFLVDESYEGDNREEGYVTTKSKLKIKLTPDETHAMLFWDFHANEKQSEVPAWGSGLHRYFEDEQAVQILRDIVKLKKGTSDEHLAEEFLNYFVKINQVDLESVAEKNGALQRQW